MAQQKLIQYANEFVDESTRLLDSLAEDYKNEIIVEDLIEPYWAKMR